MVKYTQDIKDKAVVLAKEGKSLLEIQRTIGPNPKATQRYLKAVGIEWKDLRAELVKEGKVQPAVKKQKVKA